MNDFIKELNLPFEGKMLGNSYVITTNNSKDFALMYSIISSKFDEDHSSGTTESGTSHVFYSDWYTIRISANFDNDTYSLVIEER